MLVGTPFSLFDDENDDDGSERSMPYFAPPPERVASEMKQFLDWFRSNDDSDIDVLVKSGVAHYWFELLILS